MATSEQRGQPVSRLPYLTRETLPPEGQAVWDSLTASRGNAIVNDQGGLVGPFNPWLHAPDVGSRLAELGATLRFGTSVDRTLLELAIITVGAHWKAEFEWWAHSRMAREHGVAPEIVDAIGRGETPSFDDDGQRVVYTLARQLVTQGGSDDLTYDAARTVLGDQGLVEIVSLCGYYTLVSFTLNAFAVPLPPGVSPMWPT